jgi:cytochrome c553
MRSIGWIIASAALLPGFLLLGAAAAFAQKPGAASANAEIAAAEAWAFPLNPSAGPRAAKPDVHKSLRVPGSQRRYTRAQYDDMLGAPDWFPQDHPPMPQIVARGREPAWACAYCHLPNGQGRPENAVLAGLPGAYIVEQVHAFRSGERASLRLPAVQFMASEARHLSDSDLQLAADYFAKLKFTSRTRVIESATVPRTHWAHFMLVPDPSELREPIGNRIIETPTNIGLTELRDPRAGFVAYVPPGSIARGALIAAKGEGAMPACESCHGAHLQGAGNIPPLAGRSPTYIVRELILFLTGQRGNAEAAPMRLEASQLSVRDMIAVAAYAASRKP